MKHLLIRASLAFWAILAVSCIGGADPQILDNTKPESEVISPVSIVATLDADTSFSYLWRAGDELLVEFNGNVNTLSLMKGSHSRTALFAGGIKGKVDSTTVLTCRLKSQGSSASSGSLLNQDGTMESALNAGSLIGTAQYGTGKNISCNLAAGFSVLKIDLLITELSGKVEEGTLSYTAGTEELSSVSFVAGADGCATFYMSVPAGTLAGGESFVCKMSGAEKSSPLGNIGSFDAGKIYEKAVCPGGIDISTITGYYIVPDKAVIFGKGDSETHIGIADGSSITIFAVTNVNIGGGSHTWAGISCEGDATITLKGKNSLKGGNNNYPGIFVPAGKTLTIQGDGELTASSNGYAPGIGAPNKSPCGNIVIKGGKITAIGGGYSAGIGGALESACGNITITGGDITATGGLCAAGIGTGFDGHCGSITITNTVTKVTATRGSSAKSCIGRGYPNPNHPKTCYCGTVTIGGVEYGSDGVTDWSFTYQP